MIKAKKFCALLLALLLTMSLAACGGGAENTNGPTPQKQFSAGTTTGNTYTNEYFGFTCTLDESWVFLFMPPARSLLKCTPGIRRAAP